MTGMSDDQVSTHLDKVCLLHCLMAEGDTGRTSPNAIVSFHIRKHGNEVFSSAVRAYGFPYKWVQNVCGIGDDVELPDGVPSQQQVDLSAETIELVIKKLKSRFRAQANLLVQVVSLSTGVYYHNYCMMGSLICTVCLDERKMILEPGKDSFASNSKLVQWKQVPLTEAQVKDIKCGTVCIGDFVVF